MQTQYYFVRYDLSTEPSLEGPSKKKFKKKKEVKLMQCITGVYPEWLQHQTKMTGSLWWTLPLGSSYLTNQQVRCCLWRHSESQLADLRSAVPEWQLLLLQSCWWTAALQHLWLTGAIKKTQTFIWIYFSYTPLLIKLKLLQCMNDRSWVKMQKHVHTPHFMTRASQEI